MKTILLSIIFSLFSILELINIFNNKEIIINDWESIYNMALILCFISSIIYISIYIKERKNHNKNQIFIDNQIDSSKTNPNSNIYNELSTHVNNIFIKTEHILTNTNKESPTEEDLNFIKQNTIHVLNIINKLLNVENEECNNKIDDKLSFTSKSENDFINRVIDIIKANYTDSNFTPDDIINEIGISRSSLFKKVKNLIGLTPMELLRNIRLKAAINLLMEDISITEIAFKTGFNDSNYFSKCFKNMYGKSPKDYKNEELLRNKSL